jgi:transcriptional regulator of arginine metabolism
MDKANRQREILLLLDREVIANQEELRIMLQRRGFDVTQATLSRDLKQLGVVKQVTVDGVYKYTVGETVNEAPVRSCESSGNLVVITTEPGLAAAVAYKIDAMKLSGVLGTVAGEDTLLVVVAQGAEARAVRDELWRGLVRGPIPGA